MAQKRDVIGYWILDIEDGEEEPTFGVVVEVEAVDDVDATGVEDVIIWAAKTHFVGRVRSESVWRMTPCAPMSCK